MDLLSLLVPTMWIPGLLVSVPPRPQPKVVELAGAFHQTLVELQVPQKHAAIDMGLDGGTLSRQVNEWGLNLSRLVLMSVSFWERFLPRLAGIVGCEHLLASKADPSTAEELERLRADFATLTARVQQLADLLARIEASSADRRRA